MDFKSQEVVIEGMHCDACVRRVMQALGNVPGIRVSSVEIGKARLVAEAANEARVREAIDKIGFSVKEMHAAN